MSKGEFHIGKNGVEECQAFHTPCPLSGEHYKSADDAERAVAAQYGGSFGGQRLPNVNVPITVVPFAGGRYYGAHVKNSTVEPFLKEFRSEVGADAADMEAAKVQRDRGKIYHLTVVGPPEMKQLGKTFTPFPSNPTVSFTGIGKAVDGPNEAWFITCDSPEVNAWRAENGLSQKDLHITLGFKNKDVHTQPKGESSIVIR